jgi:hypothetical protein
MAQSGSGGRSYAVNPFAAGAAPGAAPSVAKTQAYADGLRNYAGGSVNQMAGQPQMAAHLSQAPRLDADYLETYRGLKNDPVVPADQKLDIDRVWRATPNAGIFKEGYAHNPYVEQKVQALRAEREAEKMRAQGFVFDESNNRWNAPGARRGSADGD